MKFAFLIHPLTDATKTLLELDPERKLHREHGGDLLSFCASLHKTLAPARRRQQERAEPRVRVIDELAGLVSATGARADGRFYEIPLDAWQILDDPARAVGYMEQAVDEAAAWGARLVGLGSM
ncbi:MAG TPA: hypothetical protein VGX78_12845, partial [Pirellulales bacterium]|nr:hypothetical protein [Pirellulales bacterium]